MGKYLLEWRYRSGIIYSMHVDDLLVAQDKAKSYIKNSEIIEVTISKYEIIERLKSA